MAGYADLRRSRSLEPSLGPAIAKDVRLALAMRMTPRERRQRIAAEMPQIRRVARQGRAYYYAVYREAIRQGDPPQEARAKEQEAEDTWDKDVALQNAWDHNDQDAMNHIEAGDWSPEQMANYEPAPPENTTGGNDNEGGDSGGGGESPSPEPAPEPEPTPPMDEGGE